MASPDRHSIAENAAVTRFKLYKSKIMACNNLLPAANGVNGSVDIGQLTVTMHLSQVLTLALAQLKMFPRANLNPDIPPSNP